MKQSLNWSDLGADEMKPRHKPFYSPAHSLLTLLIPQLPLQELGVITYQWQLKNNNAAPITYLFIFMQAAGYSAYTTRQKVLNILNSVWPLLLFILS